MNQLLRWSLAAAAAAWVGRMIVRELRSFPMQDKVVLISGGSRGLGLLMAREFGRQGAKVVLLARDQAELGRAEAELAGKGIEVNCLVCDIAQRSEVDGAVRSVMQLHGRIDVLVNNAGVIQVGPMDMMTIDDFEEAMDIHFWGALHLTLATIPSMRACGGGRIVNIASIGGKVSVPHLLPYCASKFALVGLSEGLRSELQPENIFVTTVCPGLMRTGSHINAYFKGKNEDEFAWFSIGNALPISSIDAERAARQIVSACRRGDAELIISPQAQLMAKLNAVVPGLMADLLSVVNRFLPTAGGIGRNRTTGRNSTSAWSPSVLTALADRASVRNNEV